MAATSDERIVTEVRACRESLNEIRGRLSNSVDHFQSQLGDLRDSLGKVQQCQGDLQTQLARIQESSTRLEEDARTAQSFGVRLADMETTLQKLEETSWIEGTPPPPAANLDTAFLKQAMREVSAPAGQEAILQVLLNLVGSQVSRAILFVHEEGRYVAWNSVGFPEDAIRSVQVDDPDDPIMAAAKRKRLIYREQAPAEARPSLGAAGDLPHAFLAIPLVFDEFVPVILYADSSESINVDQLEVLTYVAALVLKNNALHQMIQEQAMAPAAAPAPEAKPVAEPTPEPVAVAQLEPEPVAAAVAEETGTLELPSIDFGLPTEVPGVEADILSQAPESMAQELTAQFSPLQEELAGEEVATEEVAIQEVAEVPAEELAEQFEAPAAQVTPRDLTEWEIPESMQDSSFGFQAPPPEPPPAPVETEPAFGEWPSPPEPIPAPEPVPPPQPVAPPTPPARPALSPEDEEKYGNEARRFARLLVSEIKLYNEDEVYNGRQHGDLYNRLKRDIDRSREMYEKRVHPEIAKVSDHFHEELIRILAREDLNLMGQNYPGPVVRK